MVTSLEKLWQEKVVPGNVAGVIEVDDREQEARKLDYYQELLYHSGVDPSGSILELASGSISLGQLFEGVVAVDIDPDSIRDVHRQGIDGVIATIENLPFAEKSFDYVIAFNPPLKVKVESSDDDICQIIFDRDYERRMIDMALKLAKGKVLIVSYHIAQHPPYMDRVEKRAVQPYHYVVYKAGNFNNN